MNLPRTINYPGFEVSAPPPRDDLTDELPAGSCHTLARPEGPGVLQMSLGAGSHGPAAGVREGAPPSVLLELSRELGQRLSYGPAFDEQTRSERIKWGAASYRVKDGEEDVFVRIWHVSNGSVFARATYNCQWSEQDQEREEVEAIVASFRFDDEIEESAAA